MERNQVRRARELPPDRLRMLQGNLQKPSAGWERIMTDGLREVSESISVSGDKGFETYQRSRLRWQTESPQGGLPTVAGA